MLLVQDRDKASLKPATILLTALRQTTSLGNKEVTGGQMGGAEKTRTRKSGGAEVLKKCGSDQEP